MYTSCQAELDTLHTESQGVPTQNQPMRIIYAHKALAKCSMPPKQVFSAMINCFNPNSWRIPFPHSTCPTLNTCLSDALLMRSPVLLHSLCAPLACALTASGVEEFRVISICLGHLDAQSLHAARLSLAAVNCPTGPTINDSLLVTTCPPQG